MKVIDTDILIDHFHGNRNATSLVRDWLLAGERLVISVITVTEILAGIRSGEEADTEALLSLFQVHVLDEPQSRMAGAYLNQFGRTHRMDLGDAVVAATARTLAAPLVTRNRRHYPMTDIEIIVPYERGS